MEIDISRPEGNAFAIMGLVKKMLEDTGRRKEINGVMKRMTSGDYENLKAVATEISKGSITFTDSRETDDD